MSKEIDYDELDKAVTDVMGSDEPASPAPIDPPSTPVKRPPVKPRGLYMDMVNRRSPSSHPSVKPPAPKPAPTKVEHHAEFGVIEDSPIPYSTSAKSEVAANPPAPNLENFSTGGRSPFLENALVEKRPLGDSIPDSNPRAVPSTKNVYSQRSAAAREPLDDLLTHEIVPEKRKFGIGRILIILFIILLGGAIGAGAWYLMQSGLIEF